MTVVYLTDNRLGIYIHIPFCRSKCAYCDFYSFVPNGVDIFERYTNSVISHMEYYKNAAADRVVDSIFIGGGTPTVLPTEYLVKILKAVKKNFKIQKNAEVSIEVNPATADKKTFTKLRRAGVNRVSIGLQSAIDAELKTLSRVHTRDEFEECYYAARSAKIKNINIDLMFGTPGETPDNLYYSIDYVTRLRPEHISLYNLKIEPNTKFGKMADSLILPDEDAQYDMYMGAIELLSRRGYQQYEISNFSLPGKSCRHNLKYWNCGEYLGFGPSAYSYFNKNRFAFVRNAEQYMRGTENIENRVGITTGLEEISGRAQMGEYVMLRMRLCDGVNFEEFRRRFGCDFGEMYGQKLKYYIDNGFVRVTRDSVYLTPPGMLVSNFILSDVLSFEDLNVLSPANNF